MCILVHEEHPGFNSETSVASQHTVPAFMHSLLLTWLLSPRDNKCFDDAHQSPFSLLEVGLALSSPSLRSAIVPREHVHLTRLTTRAGSTHFRWLDPQHSCYQCVGMSQEYRAVYSLTFFLLEVSAKSSSTLSFAFSSSSSSSPCSSPSGRSSSVSAPASS